MSREDFVKRFFGPEGNTLEHSFIALDDEEPVGLILGGIKEYEGLKTIRCGTLCISPDYRGKGVSKQLFMLHRQTAVENGCRQMFLEVIAGNDRAVKFYSNLGYEKFYDLRYYSHPDATGLQARKITRSDIKTIDNAAISGLLDAVVDVHINWQNELDYVEKLQDITYYGAYEDSQLVGGLAISTPGKIFFIRVMPQYRNREIASSLIVKAIHDLQLKKLSISTPNNARLEGFLKHMNFEKDNISQYEMYLII
jgi:ribosomal protein S18 acetylase RimI-like enzyme